MARDLWYNSQHFALDIYKKLVQHICLGTIGWQGRFPLELHHLPSDNYTIKASAERRPAMSEQTVSQTSYYPEVECEARKGDADWEVIVGVKDEKGHKQFLSVSNGMITEEA